MNIKFQQISIRGFGSIEEIKHVFSNNSITVIKGENGTGKTSIFSALYWALYGDKVKPKSSINTWPHIQPKDYKGTKVEVNWYEGNTLHTVTRCENWKAKVEGAMGNNRLIYNLSTKSHKKQVQEDITEAIGMSSNLFKNSIMFGQKMKRLIEDTGADKKKTLEECFDIGYINKAIELAKESLFTHQELRRDVEDEFSRINGILLHNESELDRLKTNYKNSVLLYNNKRESLQEIISLKQDKLNDVDEKIDTYNKAKKDFKELEKEIKESKLDMTPDGIDDLNEAISQKSVDIRFDNTSISNIEKDISEGSKKRVCRACNRPMDRMELPEKVTKLKEITKLKKSIKQVQGEKEKLEQDMTRVRNFTSRKYELNHTINSYTEIDITELKKEIKLNTDKLKNLEKPVKADTTKLDKDNEELNTKKQSLTLTLNKHQRRINLYYWLINTPLSNKGLKAYLFEMLLSNLNEMLIKYQEIVGWRVEFNVDMDKSNKDIYTTVYDNNNIPVLYEDLSGGQQQMVNVATALALHDLINEVKPFNLLILDEVFEGLDRNNIHKVTELLTLKSSDYSVYVITHHEAFNPVNCKTINLVQSGGLTYEASLDYNK
tara:strand:+ start:603 stop:2414 length:1812 start_codon:yes stop_codon:yes gene_type:complete